MKKLFLIFLSLFCISCSSFNPYVDQKTRDELFRKGTFELMTEEEKQNLYAGGTASAVIYTEPYTGIIGQQLLIIFLIRNKLKKLLTISINIKIK